MKYADLKPESQSDLATYEVSARGIIAGLVRVAKDGNAAILAAFAATRVTPVVAKMEPSEEVPTTCGYAGATAFTVEELVAVQNLLHELNVLFMTNLVLISKAAGVNA